MRMYKLEEKKKIRKIKPKYTNFNNVQSTLCIQPTIWIKKIAARNPKFKTKKKKTTIYNKTKFIRKCEQNTNEKTKNEKKK